MSIEKRHPASSGASCVNDGAVRYGPRRLLWLVYRHFFAEVDPQGIFSSALHREV